MELECKGCGRTDGLRLDPSGYATVHAIDGAGREYSCRYCYPTATCLEDAYIGRMAVCQHGIIGEIESYERLEDTIIWRGKSLLSKSQWQSVQPRFIRNEDAKLIRKILRARSIIRDNLEAEHYTGWVYSND
jgi:hypothetical protein